MKSSILITGGTGFIGSAFVERLLKDGLSIILLVRNPPIKKLDGVTYIASGKYFDSVEVSSLRDVDAIVHFAGVKEDSIDIYKVNVDVTESLAKLAKKINVSKFIFLSSVGVHGSFSYDIITEESPYKPVSPYTKSKVMAEKIIVDTLRGTNVKYYLIRPPVVYSEDAEGSFGLLLKLLSLPVLLPFGSANNKRSMISLNNLVDFLQHTLLSEKGESGAYLICDSQVNSIKEIVIKLRVSMGKSPVNVVRFPIVFLKYLLFGLGKKSVYEHLFLSLRMDCTKAKEVFDWTPVVNINDELNRIGNCRSYND